MYPAAGAQHLRISYDPGLPAPTNTGAFSPSLGTLPTGSSTTVVDIRISAAGGADYFVAGQSNSEDSLTWEVNFSFLGTVWVVDDLGLGWALVDTGFPWTAGSYKTLVVCDDPVAGTTQYVYGGVDYTYRIGRFEITAGQYTEFLNAVAATDTYGLYNPEMDNSSYGCQITRNGDPGGYTYDFSGRPSGTEADWADRPVNYVSWGDAAWFANWLHNGQPTGAQDLSTTEDGSYYLNGAMSDAELLAVVCEPDATWVIPSEDEWYKAAYYNGANGVYYDYPTSTDAVPNNGNPEGDTGNSANFYDGDYTIGDPYWRTQVGFFGLSESPYNTFDQGGNVWEWNEAVLDGSYRGLRGGSFFYYDYDLRADDRYSSFEPTYEYDSLGFRLAKVSAQTPVPAVSEWGMVTMALLVLTAGTLVCARRGAAVA